MSGKATKINNELSIPDQNTIWEHVENGNRYYFLLVTNINCENKKFVPTVVYGDLNTGVVYSRPLSEWHLRFIDVTSLYNFELTT